MDDKSQKRNENLVLNKNPSNVTLSSEKKAAFRRLDSIRRFMLDGTEIFGRKYRKQCRLSNLFAVLAIAIVCSRIAIYLTAYKIAFSGFF